MSTCVYPTHMCINVCINTHDKERSHTRHNTRRRIKSQSIKKHDIHIYIYIHIFTSCVWMSANVFIKGHILSTTWLHTKIHVYYVVSAAFWKGNSRNNFKCDLLQQNHARRRSYRQIHPPLKNYIYTLGVKSIWKLCFSRCMRSTKKSVSYGAWEAQFWFLQHLYSKTATLF